MGPWSQGGSAEQRRVHLSSEGRGEDPGNPPPGRLFSPGKVLASSVQAASLQTQCVESTLLWAKSLLQEYFLSTYCVPDIARCGHRELILGTQCAPGTGLTAVSWFLT